MKRIAILGSTGSIGQSALAVAEAHPERLRVVALAAGGNVARLVEQIERVAPDAVAMAEESSLASSLMRSAEIPVVPLLRSPSM